MSDKMFANTIEKRRETPDSVTEKENDEVAENMELMEGILTDFGASDFTLEELADNLPGVSQEGLDYLVSKGMLLFDEETEEYSVDHNSPDVAKIQMGGGLERRIDTSN